MRGAMLTSRHSREYDLAVLSDAPVAYFPLDDAPGSATARNLVGSGDGTVYGGVTFGRPGAVSSEPAQTAASFDGSTGYVSLPPGPMPAGNSAYTLEVLFATGFASSDSGTAGTAGNGAGTCIALGIRNANLEANTLRFAGATGIENYWWAEDLTLTTPYPINDNHWHHVSASCDGRTRTIYLDGVIIGSDGPGTHNVVYGFAALGFSPTSSNTNEYLLGALAKAAIYDYALPADRIASHYNIAKA